jgi:hypothetical protein
MAFNWQRDIDINVAASSRKQGTIGTAHADGLLDEALRLVGPTIPVLSKEFRSDKGYIKGLEWAGDLTDRRHDLRWSPSFDSSSWLLAWAYAFLLGDVTTSQPDIPNDPNAYLHVIIPTRPPTDQPILPVTTVSVQHLADVNQKFADLVAASVTLPGGNNSAALGLAVEWIGSGVVAAGHASYPALTIPELGLLFNSDMVISLGTEGSPVDISERIQEWSITITNNFKPDLAYYPGSGKFRGRFPHGARDATVQLGVFAKDVDDIKTLFDGTATKEIKFLCLGDLTTGGTTQANSHQIQLRFPATRIVTLEPDSGDEFRLWRLNVPPEGVFLGSTLTEPFEIRVINEEPTFLATS